MAVWLTVSTVAFGAPAAADSIRDKRAQAAALAQKIDQLDQRISMLAERVDQAEAKVSSTAGQVDRAAKALAAADSASSGARQSLVSEAVRAYTTGGRTMPVVSAGSDPALAAAYQRVLQGDEADTLDTMRAALALSREKKDALDRAKKAADDALVSVKAEQKAATQADAQLRATQAQVTGELTQLVAAEQARQEAARLAAVRAQIAAAGPSGPSGPPPPVGHGAAAAVAAARAELGKPYVWAAAGPNAFDCSGLTMWAWHYGGVALPHQSGEQYASIPHVSLSDLQPGDLVFYGHPIHHVGIYIGGGQMIDAPHTGANVRVDSIAFDGHIAGAGRP